MAHCGPHQSSTQTRNLPCGNNSQCWYKIWQVLVKFFNHSFHIWQSSFIFCNSVVNQGKGYDSFLDTEHWRCWCNDGGRGWRQHESNGISLRAQQAKWYIPIYMNLYMVLPSKQDSMLNVDLLGKIPQLCHKTSLEWTRQSRDCFLQQTEVK